MWKELFFGLAVIYGVMDLGFAIGVLVGSIDPSPTMTMSIILFISFAAVMTGVYFISAIVAWIILWMRYQETSETSDIRFYMVHFFKCSLGAMFSMFFAVGWIVKYKDFVAQNGTPIVPVFLLETDPVIFTTIADLITMDSAFIIYRVMFAFQMVVSVFNIRDLLSMFHMKGVTDMLGFQRPINTQKMMQNTFRVKARPRQQSNGY